ncbi:MAG: protein phosphatase 2C domain-containing protein [Verrucomicrobiae bacterium]|nr:protein phosphatase 2C domain-containing protein [Verrucomicrobiae bacterium]NNJ43125.1 serine/threonine-protein phosphatase [Akkermansiaceae bacterium]
MTTTNPFLPGAQVGEQDESTTSITWSAQSVSGRKKPINDDAWLAFASDIKGASLLEKDGTHSLDAHDLIYAVSDGMGGGNAGDVASRLMLEQLSAMIPRTFKTAASGLRPGYFTHLQQAIQAVHLAVNGHAGENDHRKGMAATLALTWFTPENLYLCNVGDSRIYLHRKNTDGEAETRQLTEDHTFAWKKFQRGELNERSFRAHPRRSALYEVVGGGHRTVNPYIAAFPYQAGDRFLLCSDGLIDGLWDKHIHSAFLKNPDSTSDLAESLMSRAVTNDGNDDTTVIALHVHDMVKKG